MSDKRYFDLTIPAPKRLAMMRAAFENHAKRYPHCPEYAKPSSWRAIRAYTFSSWRAAFCDGLNAGFNDGSPVWYSHGGEQFKREQFADVDHNGWYTNEEGETARDGSGLARGIVVNLSHGRFIAGYWWGDNGERVYFPEIFTDESEAARHADYLAERFAENARDDNAKYNEARRLEDESEEKRERLAECLALARINHKREAMREEARELIARIREIRETLKSDFSAYV